VTTASNMADGDGPAWFLVDTSRAVRPVIFQKRIDYNFQQLTKDTDENVFMRDQYLYGVRARLNVGFGLWQLAYGSKGPLDADAYGAARAAMHALTGDEGRPLGIRPDTLIVPTAMEADGLSILNAELVLQGGAAVSNIYKGTAKLIVTPWLN
jgi:phage major head subunit gpT-like protein